MEKAIRFLKPTREALFLLFLVVIILVGVVLVVVFPVNHDMAWRVTVAEGLVNGKELYVDFVDPHFPMITLITILPTALAMLLGLGALATFKVFVFVLALVTLLLSYKILAKAGEPPWPTILIVAFFLLIYPAYGFGQKEHLITVLILPYTLSVWTSVERLHKYTKFTTAVMFAVGVWIKPQYLLFALLLELYRFLKSHRVITLERLVLAMVFVVQALFVLLFAPNIGNNIAYTLLVYGEYSAPLLGVIGSNFSQPSVVLILVLAVVGVRYRARVKNAIIIIATVVLLYVLAVQQLKGFDYHFMPNLILTVIGISMAASYMFQSSSSVARWLKLTCQLFVIVVGLAITTSNLTYGYEMRSWVDEFVEKVNQVSVNETEGDASMVYIATGLFPGFPVVNYSTYIWGSRFPTFWGVPYCINHQDACTSQMVCVNSDCTTVYDYIITSTVDDFRVFSPELVIVHDTHSDAYSTIAGDEEVLEWFLQDERFRVVWNQYEERVDLREYDFRYYVKAR